MGHSLMQGTVSSILAFASVATLASAAFLSPTTNNMVSPIPSRRGDKRALQLQVLDQQPKLGAAWLEADNPEFLLLSDVPEEPNNQQPKAIKRSESAERLVGKRGLSLTSNLDLLRQHSGFGSSRGGDRGRALASRGKKWSGVANNMQLLREGSWERRTRGDRLYMEVARKKEGGLANLG